MNFNSLSFFIFLPLVTIVFRILPKKFRWIWLLGASLYFYMSWNPVYLLLILTSSGTAFFCGLLTERSESQKIRKACFLATLFLSLGLLILFKYADFLLQSVSEILGFFGMTLPVSSLGLVLPVGISFYTFQTLSYVIDVYRRKVPAEKHFGYFLLYVCFFPQLVAGPIEKPEDLLPQLKQEKGPSPEDTGDGIRWLVSGFYRKCVIADMAGICVDRVYAAPGACSGPAVLAASSLFLLQIYNDFAGYSEIAMGSARLLGIRLTLNFNSPLISESVTEFFRRWHITLNRWFTEYVYIPLGGSRKGLWKKFRNTMIVFLLCGLWHGANWTYVLWGGAAGIFVCVETLLKRKRKTEENTKDRKVSEGNGEEKKKKRDLQEGYQKGKHFFKRILMFFLFSLSCVLFRSASVQDAGEAFRQIFTSWEFTASGFGTAWKELGFSAEYLLFFLPAVGVMAQLPKLTLGREKKPFSRSDFWISTFLFLAVFCCFFDFLSASDVTGFRYFQF